MADVTTDRATATAASDGGGGFGSGVAVGLLVIIVVIALLLFFGFSGRGGVPASEPGTDAGVPADVNVNLEGGAGIDLPERGEQIPAP